MDIDICLHTDLENLHHTYMYYIRVVQSYDVSADRYRRAKICEDGMYVYVVDACLHARIHGMNTLDRKHAVSKNNDA